MFSNKNVESFFLILFSISFRYRLLHGCLYAFNEFLCIFNRCFQYHSLRISNVLNTIRLLELLNMSRINCEFQITRVIRIK